MSFSDKEQHDYTVERGDSNSNSSPERKFGDKVHTEDVDDLAKAALAAKPHPWSAHMIRLYAMLVIPFLCSTLNGYDGSLMSAINAMPHYQSYFGQDGAGLDAGATFAIYNGGAIASVPFAGPLNDYMGRKWGIFTGCAFVVIGTVIQAPSINLAMFFIGRFILGFGVGFCQVSAPMYVAEMAHPSYRGVLTGFYNTLWYVGSIVASWVCYGSQYIDSDVSWRLPLWCQLICSAIAGSLIMFLPESPRWLMAHGHRERGLAVLTKYHGDGDPYSPFVKLQMAEMESIISIEQQAQSQKWYEYRGLFNSRAARRRMICVVGMGFFGQYSGNAVISYFFPVVVGIAGIKSANTQLLLNALQPIFSWIASMFGAYLIEARGRRPMLLYTAMTFPIYFLVMFGTSYLAVNDNNLSAAYVTIAFSYLFMIVFSLGWTPLQALYPVECLPTETRAKGNAIQSLTSGVASFIGQFGGGTALGRISYWYYLFFVFWDMFEVAVIYLYWPETKGRTLEELSAVFEAKNPVKASMQKRDEGQIRRAIRGERGGM